MGFVDVMYRSKTAIERYSGMMELYRLLSRPDGFREKDGLERYGRPDRVKRLLWTMRVIGLAHKGDDGAWRASTMFSEALVPWMEKRIEAREEANADAR